MERDRAALAALRANVEAVGLGGTVVAGDVERLLDSTTATFDLVFVDPPWDHSLASVEAVLAGVDRCLSAAAMVVVHRRAGEPAPAAPDGWSEPVRRKYGDTVLWSYERLT